MRDIVYSLDGFFNRHMDVYEDRVVITVKEGFGSFLTGNMDGGAKTIYYEDCVGIQVKKPNLLCTVGYLQLETASGVVKNPNQFNANSFPFKKFNEKIEEVVSYVCERIEKAKSEKKNGSNASISGADEIKKYKDLLDAGIISQDEFDIKKKQLLGL